MNKCILISKPTRIRISFDFDDTLCMLDGTPNHKMIQTVHDHHGRGHECHIVTARHRPNEKIQDLTRILVKDFIKQYKLPIVDVHFTSHMPKGPLLKILGIKRHYDDNLEQLSSVKDHGIEAIHPDHQAFLPLESSFDNLMAIAQIRGGWLDQYGEPHPCPPMSHETVLMALPEFADLNKKPGAWDKMTQRAYDLGFVRIVINSGNVYAEGKRKAITRNRHNLQDLASMLGEDAQVVPTYR